MTGWMPGGSAGMSFSSWTDMSISFRAIALSPVILFYGRGHIESSRHQRLPGRSDRLDAGFGDNVTPFRHFVFDALPHTIGPIGDHLKSVIAQLCRDLRSIQYLD